jgi:hypothetical protein
VSTPKAEPYPVRPGGLAAALEPAQIDAEADPGDTVEVSYRGVVYVFPASLDDADGDVLDAIDNKAISHALRGLLGAPGWAAFKATQPRVKHYGELFEVYAQTIGLSSTGE